MDSRDLRTGERTQVGARVDEGVYQAFLDWVEETSGRHYGEVGDALTRAMLEFMNDERVEDQLDDLADQTMKNEALLRKVLTELDKKEKEPVFSDDDSAKRGKSPEDRQKREAMVIKAVASQSFDKISQSDLEKAIREAAGVSSDPTIDDYVRALTQTKALDAARTANHYYINHEGAREFCRKHGVSTNGIAAGDEGVAADD